MESRSAGGGLAPRRCRVNDAEEDRVTSGRGPWLPGSAHRARRGLSQRRDAAGTWSDRCRGPRLTRPERRLRSRAGDGRPERARRWQRWPAWTSSRTRLTACRWRSPSGWRRWSSAVLRDGGRRQ